MAYLSYTRIGRRWRRMRGFRLHPSRCSVHRLRVRLLSLLRLLTGCLKSLKSKKAGSHGMNASEGWERSSGRRALVYEEQRESAAVAEYWSERYCSSSNSFYAEAIADCLEFIKRTSVSVENDSATANH